MNPDQSTGGGKAPSKAAWLEYVFLALLALAMVTLYFVAARSETTVIQGQRLPTFLDDTYISMRYARHLVNGHGLVWNVGEAPVEGYTNFLWVMWIALLMTIVREPSYAMIASAAAFHVMAALLLYRLFRKCYQVHWLPACSAALLLGAWEPIRTQVFTALEAPMLLVLFVAALSLLSERPTTAPWWLAGPLVSGMLPLVRPDGLFLTLLLAAVYWGTQRPEARLWQHLKAGLCFFGPLAALTLLRAVYFGDVLPNTYYLKVLNRPDRLHYGIDYVVEFLRTFYGTVLLVPLVLVGIFLRELIARVAAWGIVGILAYVAYQGGDYAPWWRFMVPMLPLFLILFALTATKCLTTVRLRFLGVVLCMVLLLVGLKREYLLLRSGYLLPKPGEETADNIRLGLSLKAVCSTGTLTADFWAGATPYFSGLRSVDMLGRSDPVIARGAAYEPRGVPGHDKFDFDYVLSRKPDVIISSHPLGTRPAELEVVKKSHFAFGAYLLEKLKRDGSYVPVDSVLSRHWHAIYVHRDSRSCDWQKMAMVERELGRACVANFTDGWYGAERDGAHRWRWNNGGGQIEVFSNVAGAARIRGELMTPSGVVTVDVFANGVRRSPDQGIVIPGNRVSVDIELLLQEGPNRVELVSRTPAVHLPTDERLLGIGLWDPEVAAADGSFTCTGLQ